MANRSATGSIILKLVSTLTNTLNDGNLATATVGGTVMSQALENGVSANQINRAWYKDDISITDGNFQDINLMTMTGEDIGAGNGVDGIGQTMDIEEIVALVIRNKTGPGQLEIMDSLPGAAPIAWIPEDFATFNNTGSLKEGGIRAWIETGTDGLDLASGSSVIRLHAADGDVTAELLVLGRHDDDESSSSSPSSTSSSTSSLSIT